MALTPEQIQSALKTLKPTQISEQKAPMIMPSATTPTTNIMPKVTQVQPLSPKQNIMSPSLQVQSGVQPEKDYKKLATPQEIATFAKMIRAGEDPEQAKRGMQKVIDKRLTQENNARGQEPKNYVMTPEMFQAEQNTPIKNFAGGAISEFTDIGRKVTSYLDNPAEMIARGLSSDQGQVTKNIQAVKEREKTPIGARLTGGDPESLAYKSGEFGADIAMTAVTPQVLTQGLTKLPVVAKALQVSPKLTKIGLGGVQGLEAATQYSAISEQRLPTAEELAFGGGFGSVFSALPMVPELVSNNIVKPVQKYFGKKAEELAVRGLVNVNDAKVIVKTLKETGEGDVGTLGRRGLSRKIAGNNTEDAVAKLENISKTNYDGVRKEVTTVSNKLGSMGVDDVVDNAMTMVGKNVEAINTKAGYTAVDNSEILAIQNAARNGTITLEQKQRSKELIDKFVNIYKRSGDVADTQIADVADELRKSIKNGIEDAVDIATNGKVNIREMNREVAVAEAFKKGIETKAVANELRQYVMQGIQGSIAGGVSNQGDFSTPEGWLKFLGGAFLGRQFGKMMSDPKYVGKLAKVVDYLSAGTRESILNYIKNPKVVKLTENQLSELLNVRNAIKSITKGTQDDLLSNIQNAGDNIPMRTTPVPSSPSSFPIVPVKKATPITPTGVVQEATPNAPLPTAVPKKTIVEKGRATHDPYKTVTMDTKVVAPKKTVVPKTTKVKQEVLQSTIMKTPIVPKTLPKEMPKVQPREHQDYIGDTTTAPKKQSVLPKPQEKQAVLDGKKDVTPVKYNINGNEYTLDTIKSSGAYKGIVESLDNLKVKGYSDDDILYVLKKSQGPQKTNVDFNRAVTEIQDKYRKSTIPTPKAPVPTAPEISYTKSPEGKRLADGKPIKEDSNTYRMLDRAEARKLEAKKAKVESVSKELQPLYEEARKYQTADEFYGQMKNDFENYELPFGDPNIRGDNNAKNILKILGEKKHSVIGNDINKYETQLRKIREEAQSQ